MLSALLNDLLVQTAVLPLLVAAAAAGLLRFAGRRAAAGGVLAGFILAYLLIVGLPALPPPSAMGKLFWAAVLGLALGLGADLAGLAPRRAGLLVGAWLALALAWLALPRLTAATGLGQTLLVLTLLAVTAVPVLRRGAAGQGATTPGVVLLALALAVGGTAFAGASASAAQLAFALAAATGGLLLWNWPVERHHWGAAGQAAFGVVVLLAAVLAFFTDARAEVLLAVLPALFAERLRNRLPLPHTATGRAVGTVALGAIAAVPAIAAVGIAFLLAAGGESPSGY